MIRRIALSFAFAAALAAPTSPARADGASLTGVLLGSEAEARGDFDAWLGQLTDAVAADVESPFAAAAFAKIRALMISATDPTVVEKKLAPVLARGVNDGESDETLRNVLTERARARGEFDAADRFGQSRGYLRRFAVVGPFGWSSGVLVHRAYAPERRDLDLAAPMDGVWGPVHWLALPVLGDNAWISPSDQIRRGDGVVYAIARVKSPTARTVAIKAYCSASFAVLVNGAPTIVADRERDAVPSAVWATARLEAGWNRILVKVAGQASFAVKLADASTGLPVADVEEGDPLGGAELPAPTGAVAPRVYRTPAEQALRAAGSDAASLAAAGLICDDEGRDWDAYGAFEAAVTAVPTVTVGDGRGGVLAANIHAAFGRFVAGFGEFPAVQRKLRAKEAFEAAAKAYPTHNSAKVRLAEYLNEDDHPDQAVKALRVQLKAQPSASASMALARVARQRGWEREAIDAANAALTSAPNLVEALEFLRAFDRKYGDATEASARTRRILAINANDGGANSQMISELRAKGRHGEALELARLFARRWPEALGWRSSVATLLDQLGRDDEALVEWRALAASVPEDAEYPRTIAGILESKGDVAGAIVSLRRSLALEPFQPSVWRSLARLEGRDVDFGAPFEPNVDELLAKLPSNEELKKLHPKAVAITVLDHDVTRVRADGSTENYIHMVWKLLDENAVKKYGDVQNTGELLEVRAILPDGRVMAPSGIPGRAYNMEGLVPGTVIEHRYFETRRGTPKGYDGGLFYFQDHDGNEPNPVLLSRFIVISPESMKLDPVKRNYDGEPQVETKDGWTVTTWEKRDLPRLEPERYMPDPQEIVSLVDYSRQPEVDDVRWQMLADREDTRPTPILAAVVRKVVKDGMGDTAKLRALYDWVNDEITGDGGFGGPTATVLAKAGDRGQLFETLVRIAGVPYRTGRAMPWNGEGRTGPVQLNASVFSRPFLWLEPRGENPMPFVMMSRLSPFGLLPYAYRGSMYFLADEAGGSIRILPASGPETLDSTQFVLTLGADAKSTRVEGSVHYRGAEDYESKRGVMESTEDARKKWAESTFNRYFASPSLVKVTFPGLEKRGESFEMVLEGTMTNYVQPQGDSYMVALGLPKFGMSQRYVERPERVFDLVLNGRDDRLDEFTIVLGDAFEVKTLPQDHVVFHRLGAYSLTWRESGGRVTVRREAHLRPARYRADEFKAFVAWCKAIDDAEERKLELRKVK